MANDTISPAAAATADRTLVIERTFRAPPDRVFRAWTDPAMLARWWGPETFGTSAPEMDVRPGGRWRTVMTGPKGESHTASGVYREILPPKRLVMTWAWEQEDGGRGHETTVEITLEPAPDGTRLTLVQSAFESREQRDSHNMGWTSSFNDLERMLGHA